jgi:tRNA-dihydrouridine synthase
MILAPLRGVTIRCFREVFADVIRDAGFDEAVTPFISANAGVDPLKDREIAGGAPSAASGGPVKVTPQFIGKDPSALRSCLLRIKEAGYDTADLNCGCPYPMVRNKGRGSGILRTPGVLEKMLAAGCEAMGPGKFSVKARLGVDRNDELLALMSMLNDFPLRFLVVHPRNARQMYDGECDWDAFRRVAEVAKMPLVMNGDLPFPPQDADRSRLMVGRGFVRWLGGRDDVDEMLARYVEASRAELYGDRAVLGRMKELIAYWKDIPRWRRLWPVVKLTRTVDELLNAFCH